MSLSGLTRSEWATMSDARARRACEQLARGLPQRLEFEGLKAHGYAGRDHRLAIFRLEEEAGPARFSLVPGGEARLGYDADGFLPTARQT